MICLYSIENFSVFLAYWVRLLVSTSQVGLTKNAKRTALEGSRDSRSKQPELDHNQEEYEAK